MVLIAREFNEIKEFRDWVVAPLKLLNLFYLSKRALLRVALVMVATLA